MAIRVPAAPAASFNQGSKASDPNTAAACAELVVAAGGNLCGFGFVAELAGLDGRSRLPQDQPVQSLIIYS